MAKAFTLVELLIVIGILAILTAAVVIVLNPGERLKEARDSQRIQDLTSLDKTIQILTTQNHNLSMGTSSVVYVSLPDTSSTCANLSLPTLPSGYTYNCITAANLRNTNGTGWVPINFQSSSITAFNALPIDPVNSTSSGFFYRYTPGGSFHLEALLESDKYVSLAASDGGTSPVAFEKGTDKTLMPVVFPTGYVKVPGNSSFGTSDFYVMQYEAKYDKSGDGVGDDATAYTCIADAGDGWDWRDTGCATGGQGIVSSPNGSPIVHITHAQALAACAAQGAHLLTNDEYMTIARDAEQQGVNWTSGIVGTGYLFNGNSADTTRGYNAATDPDKGTNRNSRAKYILCNKAEVYDVPGNVWEHVQRSTNNQGDNTSALGLPPCSDGVAGWGWCDYGSTASPYVTSWPADIDFNLVGPSNVAWDYAKGMGRIYTYKNGTSQGTTIFARGSRWDAGAATGVYALGLYWGVASTAQYLGFRCAR